MLNTEINRKKLKEIKIFSKPKKIPELILKDKNNIIDLTPLKRNKSILLTELKTEENNINDVLTLRKINIKKKLKPNKTEFLSHNIFKQINNSHNNINKTFYKVNKPMNKMKSSIDISTNLYKSNYRSHMTQTSVSFFKKNNMNKSINLRKLQNIKNLELDKSYDESKNNKVTYIEYHINQLLMKKKENSNQTSMNKEKLFNDKNIYGVVNQLNNSGRITFSENINKNNLKFINDSNYDSQKEMISKICNDKIHINKIYFDKTLENLFHKIIIIQNNKNQLENFVMSLTNEEIKLLYENKDKLPLLIKNRNNYNLTEPNNSGLKKEKKIDNLKNINFQNNMINLFLKGTKKPIIKTAFPKIKKYEIDKDNNFTNNIDNYNNYNQKHFEYLDSEINKNEISKSRLYKKTNINDIKTQTKGEDLLKNELNFLGYKNKLSAYKYNKEEIMKGEKMWEKWIEEIIKKNKGNSNDKSISSSYSENNNSIYGINNKKNEEEFKKIILKKFISQNSFKESNNIKKNKNDLFILQEDIDKYIYSKKKYYHRNKTLIINEERVLKKIKKNFKIDIFPYVNTSKGKLSLKILLDNYDGKNNVKKANNSNQINNKILLKTLLPKKPGKTIKSNPKILLPKTPGKTIIKSNPKNIPQELKDEKNLKKEEDENMEDGENKDLVNNLEDAPISMKNYFLEKYNVTDAGRYSVLNINLENELVGSNNKRNAKTRKIIPKKIAIKTDKHKNYLDNLKSKKSKSIKKSNKNNNKDKKNNNKEKPSTAIEEKEEPIRINLFGLNIIFKKGITPIQHLENYMKKKNIKNQEELKSQVELKNKITKLINKLELEKKKKRKKKLNNKKKSLSKILDINYNSEELIKLANNGKVPKRVSYFDINKIKTRQDAEKIKMQLLLKFKNDMDYKIMNGDIDEDEVHMYSRLEEKIDQLMNLMNISEYVTKIEDYIGEYQDEIKRREKYRKYEKRINTFVEKLNEDINFKGNKKNYMMNRYGKPINFSFVNQINELNSFKEF